MNEHQLKKISEEIREKIGINVKSSIAPTKPRKSLLFWFENFNRSNGPVFSIRPSGLKRHVIAIGFGPYASTCIEHINNTATQESYSLAYALIEVLDKKFTVKVNDSEFHDNWKIDTGFSIEVSRKNIKQNDSECISDSIEFAMIPLMAAVAELIGYEDVVEEESNEEGALKQSVITKRERSPRNRLLCLSIHGEKCSVCGLDPIKIYGPGLGSILEVHHIEPLSEAEEARVYNPRIDLLPLCPNCHRAIHKRKPAYKPEELNEVLKR
jgi:5-methylcytosine-specific restriction protein A